MCACTHVFGVGGISKGFSRSALFWYVFQKLPDPRLSFSASHLYAMGVIQN